MVELLKWGSATDKILRGRYIIIILFGTYIVHTDTRIYP